MKFQVVCNPVFDEKKFSRIDHYITPSAKKTLVIVGNLFNDGIINNIDLYKRLCNWLSPRFKAVIIVPGNSDIEKDKVGGRELFNQDNPNVMPLIDSVIATTDFMVYGNVFYDKNDEEFLSGLRKANDNAGARLLVVISYNIFKLSREDASNIRYTNWIYSTKMLRTHSNKFINNNVFDKGYNPRFDLTVTKRLDVVKDTTNTEETIVQSVKNAIIRCCFPDDNGCLLRLCMQSLSRD
jgi:hypothetical protein